jgi:hypothetical protein
MTPKRVREIPVSFLLKPVKVRGWICQFYRGPANLAFKRAAALSPSLISTLLTCSLLHPGDYYMQLSIKKQCKYNYELQKKPPRAGGATTRKARNLNDHQAETARPSAGTGGTPDAPQRERGKTTGEHHQRHPETRGQRGGRPRNGTETTEASGN